MIELKELTLDNFIEIKELFKEVFTSPPGNDDWSDDNQLNEYLLDIMSQRTPLILGLYLDDKLVGISIGCIRHWWGGTEYFIEELCVKTNLQGQGLGTKFLELIDKLLPSKGATQIYLQTEVDKPAYSFYKKRGFEELSGHAAFLKNINIFYQHTYNNKYIL